jgi:transposase
MAMKRPRPEEIVVKLGRVEALLGRGLPRIDAIRQISVTELPPAFGHWNSQFRRFCRWAKSGVFESLFKAMSEDPDLEYALIDGTFVQVHQKATGSSGGLSIRPLGARAVG